MAFDGVVTKSIVNELQCLINGKINKIFEPNKNELLLGIYCGGKNFALNISIDSVNYRINLTTNSKANPQNALNFCMVLRKHLVGGIIKKIYSNGLERIVFIDIECHNELNDLITKTLVVELMGKHSNVILLSDKEIVIDSLRHLNKFDNSNRDIFPGSKYVSIVSDKPDFSCIKTFDNFYKLFSTESSLGTSISSTLSKKINGFGKNNIFYLLNELKINDSAYTLYDLKKLFEYLNNMVKLLEAEQLKNTTSCITVKDNSKFFSSSTYSKHKADYFICIDDVSSYDNLSINFFIDDFYFSKEQKEEFKSYRDSVSRLVLGQIKKVKDRINNINLKINECDKTDSYKLYGELITSNLYKIKDFPQDSIVLENYYDNNNPIEIPLDKSISPSKNAKNFFKKYRKLQNTIAIVSKQKELAEQELNYLESIIYELENATTTEDLENIYSEICDNFIFSKNSNTVNNHISSEAQKIATKSKKLSAKKKNKAQKEESSLMPTKYEIDGFTVWVGKNNKQNDYLTCRLAQNSDIWFHTKDIHGSHVVIRPSSFAEKSNLSANFDKDISDKLAISPSSASSGKKLDLSNSGIPDSVLYKCACLAAYYSKARMSQNVPVDYTFIKYVKKPNGAKPGMVIYTDNKTIYANPQLAQ